MPNYDLGTAHGRIKIDVDDRGAQQAERSIDKFERAIQSLERTMATMQASVSRMEADLRSLTTEITNANRKAEEFDRQLGHLDTGFIDAARHTREWTGDLRVMTYEIHRAVSAAERFGPPLIMLGRTIKDFRGSNQGGIIGFLGSLSRAGAIGAGLGILSNQLLNVNKAMEKAPTWQKNVLRFEGAFSRAFQMTRFVNWLTRGKLAAATWEKQIRSLTQTMAVWGAHFQIPGLLKMSSALDKAFFSSSQLARGLRQMTGGAAGLIVNFNVLKSTLTSIAEAYKKLGWAGKIAVMSLTTLGTIGPAALELLSKGLIKVSNLLVGLADGIKQLSGGLLTLPGFFATIFATASTVAVVFKGITKNFKDIFSTDTAKASEAIAALPEHLKKFGSALVEVAPKYKELQKQLQINFLDGADRQVKALTEALLPRFQSGMMRVTNSLRLAKDRFVDFLTTAQTGADISRIYGVTSQTLTTLSYAIKPAAAGLRDIAMVGAQFLSTLSAGMPRVLTQFSEWARINRENGNLNKWMSESWAGLKNLARGLRDAGAAVWKLLTLFATNNGDNFLERFADSMRRLNETVDRSKASGVLHDIAKAAREMGTEHWENFKRVIGAVWDTLKAGWPVVKTFVHSVGTIMSAAIDHVLHTLQVFLGFFNKQSKFTFGDSVIEVFKGMGTAISKAFQGIRDFVGYIKELLGPIGDIIQEMLKLVTAFEFIKNIIGLVSPAFKVIGELFKEFMSVSVPIAGTVLGVALAFGLLQKVTGPLKGVLKFFLTIFRTWKDFGALIMGSIQALSMFGSAGAKAATTLTFLARAVAVASAAVAAAAVVWMFYKQGMDEINSANQSVADQADHTKKYVDNLKKAFVDDGGVAGDNVFTAVRDGAQQMLDDLQNISDQSVGMLGQITDYFSGGNDQTIAEKVIGSDKNNTLRGLLLALPLIGTYLNQATGNSDMVNRLQEMASNAKMAKQEFDSLGLGAEQLQNIISGSYETFNNAKQILLADGDAGKLAADKLQEMRDTYIQTESAARQLGSSGTTLIKGLQELAGAANDADKKLSGLRHVMEGLGIIKTDAIQAAMDWAKGLNELADSAQNVIANGGNLSQIFDEATQSFNAASPAAQMLFDQLKSLGDMFLNDVVKGGKDPAKAYAEFAGKFDAIVKQINDASQAAGTGIALTEEQAKKLASLVGIVKPEELLSKLDEALSGSNKELMLKFKLSEEDIQRAREAVSSIVTPDNQKNQNEDPNEIKIGVAVDPGKEKDFLEHVKDLVQSGKDKADEESQKLKDSGALFGRNFADGISSQTDYVDAAARALVDAAIANYHQSPPKKGPLARRGDAILYAGKVFGRQYARGITGSTGEVAGAAEGMAGAAYGGAVGMGFVGGAPGAQAGEFLGQLMTLTNFASSIVGVFQKISDTVLQAVRFISDPMGDGSFFGKKRYKRTVSQEELQKRIKDDNQSTLNQILDGGRRDTSTLDPRTGMPKVVVNPGQLPRDASKQDIQAKIIYEGQKRGMTPQQIQAALATAANETGGSFDPNSFGGQQGPTKADEVWGLFQQKESWGTQQQRTDPNYAINAFMDAYQQKLQTITDPITAATLTQNPQLGSAAAGSVYQATTNKFLPDAVKDYNSIIKNPANISPADVGLQFTPGMPRIGTKGASQNYDPAFMLAAGFPQLFSRDSNGNPIIPDWANRMAAAFNLTVDSHQDPLSLHGKMGGAGGNGGWAFDFNSPTGNTADLERFAQFLEQNMMGNLAQLIFRGNKDYGVAGGQNVGGDLGKGTYYTTGQGYDVHTDHVHAGFFMPPGGVYPSTAQMPGTQTPSFLQDYNGGDTKNTIVQRNPITGAWEVVDPHGMKAGSPPGDTYIDQYGQVQQYTDQQKQDLINQYPKQYTLPDGWDMNKFNEMLQSSEYNQLNQADTLKQLALSNADVAAALDIRDNPAGRSGYSDEQITSILESIDNLAKAQRNMDTAGSRQTAGALEGLSSSVMGVTGFSAAGNPIDTVAAVVSQATSMASDVINTVVKSIETVGAVKSITDTLVRGVSSTEDIYKNIDNVQKIFELFAGIAGSVSSIAGLAGTIVGAAGSGDSSGGTQAAAMALNAVGMIASFIQAGWEITNAVIDLGQEAYRIVGSYVGDFLGYLVGGAGGPLAGNVKFLLDQKTNQLLTYSADNPFDKRTFDLRRGEPTMDSRQQMIGNINVYGGPGSDPRDLTRQMMYQVNAAQYAGALAQ